MVYTNKIKVSIIRKQEDTSSFGVIGDITGNCFESYPNPFSGSTIIRFSISKDTYVKLYISDVLGNKIAEIFNGIAYSGKNEIILNSKNYNLNSGVYFLTKQDGEKLESIVLILLQ